MEELAGDGAASQFLLWVRATDFQMVARFVSVGSFDNK